MSYTLMFNSAVWHIRCHVHNNDLHGGNVDEGGSLSLSVHYWYNLTKSHLECIALCDTFVRERLAGCLGNSCMWQVVVLWIPMTTDHVFTSRPIATQRSMYNLKVRTGPVILHLLDWHQAAQEEHCLSRCLNFHLFTPFPPWNHPA